MSLFRISLFCAGYCLLALGILPTPILAQGNLNYPNTGAIGFGASGDAGVGVSSPSFPDTQTPGFVDHSSMSPDSWSAPPTNPAMQPELIASAIELPPAPATTIPAPNQTTPYRASLNPTINAESNSFEDPLSSQAATSVLTKTPSVPNLKSDSPANPEPASPFRKATFPVNAQAAQAQNGPPVNSNQSHITNPNFFLGQQPELLKYDSQDAFSNTRQANSVPANPPNLKSDSPLQIGKTDANSPRVASLQSGYSQPAPTSQPYHQPLAYPLQGAGSGGDMEVVNPQLHHAFPSQDLTYQNQIYSVDPQGLISQPGFGGQTSPPSPVSSGAFSYPSQQAYSVPAFAGTYPGAQIPASQWGPQTPTTPSGLNFRPDLGFRSPTPTVRNPGSYDNGEKFDFEDKKKEYPPLSEILKTGRYFGSVATRFVRLNAQNNTAFTTTSPTFVEGIAFNYDFEYSPFVRFGFESKFGPGIEFDYFRFNQQSNQAQFTSVGGVTGQIQTLGAGASQFGTLNAGETLSALHTVNLETFGVSFFKEVQLPISRINGRFGFEYTSIAQNLDANLTNAVAEIGTFNSRSDFRGIGPKFTLEYYRPVGHTKLEFVTTVSGGVSYGRRDEFVDNSQAQGFSRAGSDEFLSTIALTSGVQFKKNIAENRSIFARLGTTYSTWFGGGTGIDPQSDFGLRGFAFTVGYNR